MMIQTIKYSLHVALKKKKKKNNNTEYKKN